MILYSICWLSSLVPGWFFAGEDFRFVVMPLAISRCSRN